VSKAKKLFRSYDWVEPIGSRTIIELQKTAEILQELHNSFFNKFGSSSTKFNVLVILYINKGGMILSEIGEEMLVTKANITGLVDRLEKEGYVCRQQHPTDRRKIMAVITEKGSEYLEIIIKQYEEWSNNMMGILQETEKKDLLSILEKMQMGLISNGI
jgi:MarR family 2-MHQ and catechol resistance regulon transcriptional repressor